MIKRLAVSFALIVVLVALVSSMIGSVSVANAAPPPKPTKTPTPTPGSQTPLQIYGSWHCGNDACTWATVRTISEFDSKNHWLIDRGDGRPSVNLVVLSFVNPLKLLNKTDDAGTVDGVRIGSTEDVARCCESRGNCGTISFCGIT